jgi:hypothetical protein
MHSRRSVLNALLLTSALAFAPSLASAQDGTSGTATAKGDTGSAKAKSPPDKGKTAKKQSKKTSKKKKKGEKDEEGRGIQPPAQITTTIKPGTPTDSNGNPSVIIAPGPTAQGPGVVDNGTGGGISDSGGTTTGVGPGTGAPGGVPAVPPPISPDM